MCLIAACPTRGVEGVIYCDPFAICQSESNCGECVFLNLAKFFKAFAWRESICYLPLGASFVEERFSGFEEWTLISSTA